VPLKINSAGQYVVKVTGHPESVTNSFGSANAMSPTMEMRNSSEMQSASETTPWTSRQHRVLMAQVKEEDDAHLKQSIRKLHLNLGHPTVGQLCRILKHGGASDRAIRLAREHQCDQCKASTQPTPANPAKADRVTTFNARVGLDVKYLTGWKVNQKVPALNIVDYASSYQMVIPLFQKENSELIRKTFLERWVCWAGMPEEIVVDPSKPNVGQALTEPLELSGATVHITAADAHWQLGVGPQSPMELARSRETAREVPLPDEIAETGDAPMPSVDASRSLQAEGQAEPAKMSESAPSSYGPIRRVHGKSDPEALHRPRAMAPDDFAELLKEVIPSLVERWNLTRSPAEVLSVQELAQIQYQPDQLSASECGACKAIWILTCQARREPATYSELPQQYRPLYARLPPGGIPGIPDNALIEESADATDLLRGCIRAGRYQISPEEKVLTWRAQVTIPGWEDAALVDTWSVQDHDECVRLLAKAHRAGAADRVWQDSIKLHQATVGTGGGLVTPARRLSLWIACQRAALLMCTLVLAWPFWGPNGCCCMLAFWGAQAVMSFSRAGARPSDLHAAAKRGDLRQLHERLKEGYDVSRRQCTPLQQTPLHLAIAFGHLACAQELLTEGADPHMPDGNGDTALHYACRLG
ncbi:unnamed protein product, partial [Effrenium voratum]